jgi:hypothetical protein
MMTPVAVATQPRHLVVKDSAIFHAYLENPMMMVCFVCYYSKS